MDKWRRLVILRQLKDQREFKRLRQIKSWRQIKSEGLAFDRRSLKWMKGNESLNAQSVALAGSINNRCRIRQARPPICECYASPELDDLRTGRDAGRQPVSSNVWKGRPSATSIIFKDKSANSLNFIFGVQQIHDFLAARRLIDTLLS